MQDTLLIIGHMNWDGGLSPYEFTHVVSVTLHLSKEDALAAADKRAEGLDFYICPATFPCTHQQREVVPQDEDDLWEEQILAYKQAMLDEYEEYLNEQ